MDRDYEKIGREFMAIYERYEKALHDSEGGPREVYAIVDRFQDKMRILWLKNR